MNDVLNRQGYTQAAWLNRIPAGAWTLMIALAVCCSVLIGYSAHNRRARLFTLLPFLVAIAFFLIADIDSPRRGVIHVRPQNMEMLASASASTLKPPASCARARSSARVDRT
jgi:protein-S-isoprenylcysteine O-methyltransferase Ste14